MKQRAGKSEKDKQFIVPFVGLKYGKHTFNFIIDGTFFDDFSYCWVEDGHVDVRLLLEKKETMLIGQFSCEGNIVTLCDRCNEAFDLPLIGAFQIIFKFGTETSDDESLVILSPQAYQLDVQQYIRELIIVSLPSRIIHPEGLCNPEILSMLDQYVVN